MCHHYFLSEIDFIMVDQYDLTKFKKEDDYMSERRTTAQKQNTINMDGLLIVAKVEYSHISFS